MIKIIRNFLVRYPAITLILGFIVTFESCTKEHTIASISNVGKNKLNNVARGNYTDEDVFKGVMFMRGPVADLLQDYQPCSITSFTKDSTKISQADSFEAQIISKIESDNPGYLVQFRQKIGSGDYDIVKSTASDAAQLIVSTAEAMANLNDPDVQNTMQQQVNELLQTYGLNNSSSLSQYVSAVQAKQSDDQTVDVDVDTETEVEVAVVAVVVFAVVIGIIIVAIVVDNPDPYTSENYFSVVATQLKGI